MNNLWLVVKREYVTRVRRKSFLLATLLTPIGLALFFVAAQFIFGYGNDERNKVAIIDEGGILSGAIPDDQNLYFEVVREEVDVIKDKITEETEDGYTALVVIPKIANPRNKDVRVEYFSDDNLSIDTQMAIERRLEKALREYKIRELGLDRTALQALETNVEMRARKITVAEGESDDTTMASVVGAFLGGAMGFLMYIAVLVYGSMVMRSVMEEKMNRIVEVVISTVKPGTLLLGKIIGVGAVGLTQVVAWIILIPGLLFLVTLLFGFDGEAAQNMQQGSAEMDPAEMQSLVERVIAGLGDLNWWLIVPCFFIYFIGGYFTYASLFAAIGSAMGDDMGEGQTLTIPITIPVFLAFYIMTAAINAPNSSLAVVSSFIPLFAPIVMPARLPFDPPIWQIIGSIVVVIGFSLAMVWLAGRIYRVGILNYGKKSSFAEMGRWIFSKY